ncbi:MAG TPA: ATP-binding protein [Chryseolinea sp.]|nr:ATP-binding protein [Chryseolinea sp.]
MTRPFCNGAKIQESTAYSAQSVQQLKSLVAQGEGSRLEFKRKAAYPEKILREFVAFANTSGGILLVGIGDDGSIPGLKYPEDESHVIQQALAKIKPEISLRETFIPIGGQRTVLRYDITASEGKPHYLEVVSDVREYFVRVDDKTMRASREMREIIKRKRRVRDIKFQYGDHEKFLMQYLEVNKSITLKEFITASGLKRFYASNKLILLVLANVLRIVPSEKGDLYTLAFTKYS